MVTGMHLVRHSNSTVETLFVALLSFGCIFVQLPSTHAQTLKDLKNSDAYRKLDSLNRADPVGAQREKRSSQIPSNYGALWASDRGTQLLLQWSDIRLPNYRLESLATLACDDCAQASVTFINRQKIKVSLVIQVPQPTYKTMAEHNKLASFNRFRPPTLDVVGSQKVEMHGVQADYFRHRAGPCSLLIPIAQLGIINLSVPSCTQSEAMFDVARRLNVDRLNQKLRS